MLHDSSSLAPPPSLSDMLCSSPSPPFINWPLSFLVRPLSVEGGVATCWEEPRLLQVQREDFVDVGHHKRTWNMCIVSSQFLCWATSQRRAVMSMRRQISMSTFMAFSWILLSRSDRS